MDKAKYNRILLKLSGEALSGEDGHILSDKKLSDVATQIAKIASLGVSSAIVIGGGNIWRGARQGGLKIDRVRADHMGMLSTVINSLALQNYLIDAGVDAVVMTALRIDQMCEPYSQYKAREYLDAGKAVIVACGVGYPFFSTDTGMVLRAVELEADIILSAKNVDYVYDKDPAKYADAKKYETLTYTEMLDKGLKVIDGTAGALARDNGMKMLLFSLEPTQNIYRAVTGEKIGTFINN